MKFNVWGKIFDGFIAILGHLSYAKRNYVCVIEVFNGDFVGYKSPTPYKIGLNPHLFQGSLRNTK